MKEGGPETNRRSFLKGMIGAGAALAPLSSEAATTPEEEKERRKKYESPLRLKPEYESEIRSFYNWFNALPESVDFYEAHGRLSPEIRFEFPNALNAYLKESELLSYTPVTAYSNNESMQKFVFAQASLSGVSDQDKLTLILMMDILSRVSETWLSYFPRRR